MREVIKNLPFIGKLGKFLKCRFLSQSFQGSEGYWVERYATGGNSGAGSYSLLAEFKADILNSFVKTNSISTVIEFGCGDGNQLRLAEYPEYLGFDVSLKAISICKKIFHTDSSKSFKIMNEYNREKAQLTLSLDVIYHLIEDSIFESYLMRLFDSSSQFVIIYSSNSDENCEGQAAHVKHRKFVQWIDRNVPSWSLIQHVPNKYPISDNANEGSFADFYIYKLKENCSKD